MLHKSNDSKVKLLTRNQNQTRPIDYLHGWVEVLEEQEGGSQQNDQEQAVVVEDRVGGGLELGHVSLLLQDLVVLLLLAVLLVAELGIDLIGDCLLTFLSDPFRYQKSAM